MSEADILRQIAIESLWDAAITPLDEAAEKLTNAKRTLDTLEDGGKEKAEFLRYVRGDLPVTESALEDKLKQAARRYIEILEGRIEKHERDGGNVEYTPMEQAIQTPLKIPRSPDPFHDADKAVIGNNGPLHVLLEATAKGGPKARTQVNGWKENTQGHPVFRTPQRIKGDWTVYFRNDGSTAADAWKRVEGLSALHSKIALFFLARICDPRSKARYPSDNPVGVSYEDLRNALGFKKRGKALEDFKQTANEIVKDIADLEATVRGIMINGKPDGIAECAIFTITKVWHAQQVLFGEQAQIGWMVDPGPWARRYFNNEAKPWLATLHRTLLELDHRGTRRAEVLALHIATLLFVVAGGDQFKKQAITRTVAELLELAGELPEPEHRGDTGHHARQKPYPWHWKPC